MPQQNNFKSLSLLAILISAIMQLSIIVAYKPVQLGSLLLPGGVIGFPLIFTLCDIVAEVYGYKSIRRILWEAIFCCAFFAFSIALIIKLPSPASWQFQAAYDLVFGNIIRIFFAVLLGVVISSFVNIYLFSKWKIWLKGRHFAIRCFISSSIGELIVTFIADLTAFGGTMSWAQFDHMVLSVYIIKVVYSFIATFPAAFTASFLKKYEGINVYDYNTNFNPFSIKL